jgi:thiol-disulfide isomerase/thioredoxin
MRFLNWIGFLLAAGAMLVGCGSSSGSSSHSSPGNEDDTLGAPFKVAGGPVGSAAPVAGITPVSRTYADPVKLPAPSDRALVPASGLTEVDGWLNTTRAFTGDALKRRIILIDFWTAGCINCIHVAATLETYAQEHKNDPVLVIGVHSQKFSADAPADVVRAQMLELGITHPVALDSQHKEFDDWSVPGWPTLFLVDAHGRIVHEFFGEPSLSDLDGYTESALHEQAAAGGLATTPLNFLGHEKDPAAPLASPEKIIATPDGYAIADTGHNRIVLTDGSGAVTDVIGDGTAGLVDGSYALAEFNAPKGMAMMGDLLYVADTANHMLRAVDTTSKNVSTVAGTGDRGPVLKGSGPALQTALASPWELLAVKDVLYVANAGTHQILTYDPTAQTITAFAGSGAEGLMDGSATGARFAQPSGLASDGISLYVADAESSSIRQVDLATGRVSTLLGEGLFVWGDVDGPPGKARLQHDQGLALDGSTLYVADTYNSKIKAFDLNTQVTTTIAGDGTPPPLFYPGGLTLMPQTSGARQLLVADTDHDQIVQVDTSGQSPPAVWEITGLSPPKTTSN